MLSPFRKNFLSAIFILKIAHRKKSNHTLIMKRISKYLFLGLILMGCNSSKTSKTKESPTILKIGDQKVSVSEFKYIYNKNNSKSEDAFTESSLNEYMDLFVNFKLKVLESERLRLDTVPSFIQELDGYKKQLAKPYLSEQTFNEQLVKEAYDRLKHEVHAAHILIKVAEDACPEDSLIAYNKAIEIRKKAIAGEDFGQLAVKHSDDPSAQGIEGRAGNKGELGYFTAFSMVYPFESAAFNTPVGDISMPVRTQFGYHLIKVEDKRESKGEVRVAHIMVQAQNGLDEVDSLTAKKKIDDIYARLQSGGDWNELCNKFSEHEPSKSQNGELQPFKLGGQLGAPEFEEKAFSLKTAGEISEPVKSTYGWHIIKLIEKIKIKSFDESKAELEKKIKRDSRSKLSHNALIKRLKAENKVVEVSAMKAYVLSKGDSSLAEGNWVNSDEKNLNNTLLTINGVPYSVKKFFTYVSKNQKRKKVCAAPDFLMNSFYNTFVNEMIYEYEESHLADKYIDYRMLVKEYHDGILLFQLMDDMVWSKAVKDTVGLKAYYEANKEKYQWKERAKATTYSLEDVTKLSALKKDIADSLTKEELITKYNKESSLMLNIENGTFEKGQNKLVDASDWTVGLHEVTVNNKKQLVLISKTTPAAAKALSEARGIIISDYQNYLEREWVESLKKEKEIVVNQVELKKLVK